MNVTVAGRGAREWPPGPVAVAVFGGVDPPGRGKDPRRDLRNWQAMHAWATGTHGIVTRARPQRGRPAGTSEAGGRRTPGRPFGPAWPVPAVLW